MKKFLLVVSMILMTGISANASLIGLDKGSFLPRLP